MQTPYLRSLPHGSGFALLFITLSVLLPFGVFSQKMTRPGMIPQASNYTSFSPRTDTERDLPYNGPCKNCTEDLSARTAYTRSFKGTGENAGLVYTQAGQFPINIQNERGNWIPVDTRLKPEGNGRFAARDQYYPVAIDMVTGQSSLQNPYGEIRFNRRPELIWEKPDGSSQSLGKGNYSRYTAGDDGVYVTDVWPGIDMEMRALVGGIKTNFIVKNRPQQTEGRLLIRDEFETTQGLRVKLRGNEGVVETPAGQEAYVLSACIGYDSSPYRANGKQDFSYELTGQVLDMAIPLSVLQDTRMQYPYIIDPLVNSSNTMPMSAITGSGYSSTCTTNSCNYNMTVPTPANATVVDIQMSIMYIATGGCWLWDGNLRFASGACVTGDYNCPDFGAGTCTGTNISLFAELGSCMPTPSCAPQNVPFQLQFFRCFSSGGCSNSCIGIGSPWVMTLIGRTVETVSATANGASSTTICQGSSATLSAVGNFGVPPLTYSWNPGGSTGASVTVSPTTNTTYTLTITDACSQTSTANVTVNVTPQPATPTFTTNSPLCTGQTLNLTSPSTGGTYIWTGPNGFTSNQQNPSIPNVSTANAGTYNLSMASGTCTSQVATQTVVINPGPPAPVLSGNSPICAGSALNLTATGGGPGTYAWTGPNSFTSNSQNPTINPATAAASGTYTLVYTENGCSSTPATYNATVNPSPATPTATSNSPVCVNNTINLGTTATTTGAYAWTGPNGFTSSLQNPSIPNAGLSAGGTYSLWIVENGCSSAVSTVTVNVVNPPVTPDFTTNSPVCEGATLTLTGNTYPFVTYLWSGPNGFTGTGQIVNINPVTAAAAGNYSLQIAAAGCTSTATVHTVVVNPAPAAPVVTSNSPICAGASLNLTATGAGAGTYAWTGPNAFTSGTQNPVINPASAAAAGNYSATFIANGCSSAVATLTVVINPAPATPVVTSNAPICEGATLNLNTTGPAGASYAWTGPAGFSSGAQNPTIASATAGQSGTYSVTVTANGCVSQPGTLNVTISPTPAAPAITHNSPICEGATLQLGTTATAGSYFWTGPGVWISSLQNPTRAGIGPTQAGGYSLYLANGPCTSATATVNIQVLPKPQATYTGPTQVCGKQTILTGSGTVNPPASVTAINWYTPAAIGSGNTINHIFTQTPPTTVNGFMVALTGDNCADTAQFSVQLYDIPVAQFNGEDLCDGKSIGFHEQHSWQNNGSGSPGFAWTYNGSNISTQANPTYNFGGPGTYTVTLTAVNPAFPACTSSVSKPVTVAPVPVLSFTFQAQCVQDVTFDGKVTPDSLANSFLWDYADGNTGTGIHSTHAYAQPGTYQVQFSVVTTANCTTSVTQPVQIDKAAGDIPKIPNIITANNDNTNDIIDMDAILGGCGKYEFKIFGRWGNVVHQQTQGGKPFAGKSNDGAWVTPGVYFYVLQTEGNKSSGTLTVIR